MILIRRNALSLLAEKIEDEKDSLRSWMSYFDEKYRRVGQLQEHLLKESYKTVSLTASPDPNPKCNSTNCNPP